MRLLTLALLLCACASKPSVTDDSGVLLGREQLYVVDPPTWANDAVAVIQSAMISAYPHLGIEDASPTVHWVEGGNCIYSGRKPGFLHNGQCLAGVAYGCGELYVQIEDSAIKTVLGHELGHCFHTHKDGTMDNTHSDGYYWENVGETRHLLKGLK